MSSRSRRSVRNSDVDTKKIEEETPKKDEDVIGRRRSLRHSPGSVKISPPSKTRCTRPSPPTVKAGKSTKLKVFDSLPESPESPKTTPPARRSKRKSLDPQEGTAKSLSKSPKATTSSSNSEEKNSSTNGSSPATKRKNKKKKKTVQEVESEPCSNIENGSTRSNQRSRRKRNLSPPDDPDQNEAKTSPSAPRTSKRSKVREVTRVLIKRSIRLTPPKNVSNGHTTSHVNKSVSKRQPKRKLSPTVNGSTSPKSIPKKIKAERILQEDSEEDDTCILPEEVSNITTENESQIVEPVIEISKPVEENKKCIETVKTVNESTQNVESEDMDFETNAEKIIGENGLTDTQSAEILSLIPIEIKDQPRVELIEFLIKHLLETNVSLKTMTSPRFNKFLRGLLRMFCESESTVSTKHELCESALLWAAQKKSINLKHEIEASLMNLYYQTNFYRKAEQTANALYSATKKLQDKEKNVQACLCLSKTYHAMGNISKARANITTAKTEALKIYTPPNLQAELDLQSGIMQIAEEKDMETAFSYFKEAATGFSDPKKRSRALKYMLLSKLLVNRPEEGEKAIQTQSHVKDIDEGVEALLHITRAAITCSLTAFNDALTKYDAEFKNDSVVKDVVDKLYSKMLEKNLINIIQPYDRIQITCIADKIGLSSEEVEKRLSQLILDGQLSAQLDHRDDCLYVYPPEVKDNVYPSALETISHLDRTLSLLNRKVKQLL